MTQNREILGIFPIPVTTQQFDCGEKIREYFESQPMRDQDKQITQEYGRVSANVQILNEPEVKTLSDFILGNGLFFANTLMGWDITEMKFSQSWISQKEPGQFHTRHTHPNSVISGVYYFADDKGIDLQQIVFHKNTKPATYTNSFTPAENLELSNKSHFAWSYFTITPKKDLLLLFPSFLEHSVGTNITPFVRKSLAFNMVPADGIGSDAALTRLMFG